MKARLLLFALLFAITTLGWTQEPASGIEGDRREALDLCKEGKYVQALPLLEKVAKARPEDAVVLERLAMSLVSTSAELSDPTIRKTIRARARSLFLESQKLGNDSNMVKIMLEGIPEDGGDPQPFSKHAEAEKAMRLAESAFSRGDYKNAVEGYVRALLIDPNIYEAALYLGDAYYKQRLHGSAGEWYARAIQIDPNQETAYRYWGDSLMAAGDMKAAREKFIDAVIANPYIKRSWVGLSQWADRNSLKLTRPNIVPRAAVTDGKPDDTGKNNINITLDGSSIGKKDDVSGGAWMMYGISRALWRGDKFKQEFPDEKQYRHSLREEIDSLRMAASALDKKALKKLKERDASLANVIELDGKGLLEAHLLIGQPDQGIAQDYAAYREKNRDKLRQYLDEYVVPKLP